MKTIAEVIAEHLFLGFITPGELVEAGEGYWAIPHCSCEWRGGDYPAHVAQAIREARTVRTVEELDALPVGTVVHETHDVYCVLVKELVGDGKSGTCWAYPNEVRDYTTAELDPPCLVLWTPEDEQ